MGILPQVLPFSDSARAGLTAQPPPILEELLANSTRRGVLRIVLAHEAAISPTVLAERLGDPLSNVIYHVRTHVRDDGLKLDHTSNGRGSLEHFYVAGPLVLAYPEFVAATLSRGESGSP
jgi:hypothetical protein